MLGDNEFTQKKKWVIIAGYCDQVELVAHTLMVHEFIVLHKERDAAYFYFHYDLKNDTAYVTSGTVATQAITIAEIIDVLKATIGIDK